MARTDYVWPNSFDPVGVFQVRYKGGLAERDIVEAESFARSIRGASRLYSSLAHYVDTGTVPRGNTRRNLRVYTGVTRVGESIDVELFLLSVNLAASIYASDPRVSTLISNSVKVLSAFVTAWYSRPASRDRDLKQVVDAMTKINHERELTTREMNREREITARHYITESRRMAESLTVGRRNSPERLAESLGRSIEDLVEPVGKSCDAVLQFPDTVDGGIESGIKDAEVIRDVVTATLEPPRWVRVLDIDGVNRRTGSCMVLVEEYGSSFTG